MREYIFPDYERKLLKNWLQTGKETKQTQKLFTRMRRINQNLAVRKRLNAQQRGQYNVSKDYVHLHLEKHDSTPTPSRSTTSNSSKTSGDKQTHCSAT